MNEAPVTRTRLILEVKAIEKLDPTEEGMELNEGYQYEVNGSIPQLADGIAKMALEMDKDQNLGKSAGGAFLELVAQYYRKLKEGE